ncbi:MAG: hypothetical protein JRN01_03255 [Nitrososphaerota archaeon]|nr:hypothetical protein [Nitrososphaerota archaeon]
MERELTEIEQKLDRLDLAIIIHIYKFGPDTPWLMARRMLGNSGWAPKLDEDQIAARCIRMENMGILARYGGNLKWKPTSSIKPWLKFKVRNRDLKPRGIYFNLTKKGKRIAVYMKKIVLAFRI